MATEFPDQQLLERTAFIPGLNPLYPEGSDEVVYADDHIRLIKNVLLNNFPNFDGAISTTGVFWSNFEKLITIDSAGWITLGGDYGPAATFDNGSGVLQTIVKNLIVQQDGRVLPEEPEIPIGFVFQSMLTIAEMNAIYGPNKYVRCDGTSYPDSQMAKETGISVVPNLITNELFPRGYVTNIGAEIGDSTGKGDLVITGIDVGHNHNNGVHTHTFFDSDGSSFDGDRDPGDAQHPTSTIESTATTSSVNPSITADNFVHNHNPLTISSTDGETVPEHFFTNAMIRIN